MALNLVTGPALEPLTLAEAKAQCRISSDQTEEDGLLHSLIASAREQAETFTHRPLISQTWSLTLDSFGCSDVLWLPLPPVTTVSSIAYLDTAGVSQTWGSSNYRTDLPSGPYAHKARITPAYGVSWPQTYPVTNAVTVTFVAGYGTAPESVPSSILHAMKLLVAHWFHNREAISLGVGVGAVTVPMAVESLLWPYVAY